MENSSIRRQWLDSYQSHLLEEEHSPQTIKNMSMTLRFFSASCRQKRRSAKKKCLHTNRS